MKRLALFDFDHTLVSIDSMLAFLKYCHPAWRVNLSIAVLSLLIPFRDRAKLKASLMALLFKNWEDSKLELAVINFAQKALTNSRNKEVYDLFLSLKKTHEVYIVSASFDIWLKPWCEQENVGLICSKFDTKNRKAISKNCKGEEKLIRIKEELNPSSYSEIYAVGNLPDDAAMFSIGTITKAV